MTAVDPDVTFRDEEGRPYRNTRVYLDRAALQMEADPDLKDRVKSERLRRKAQEIVRDEELAENANLDAIDVVRVDGLLQRVRPQRQQILGPLLLEGQNATVVAAKKDGKTTLMKNVASATTSGGVFLGSFVVSRPLRVAFLNYEMHELDIEARLRAHRLDADQQERLLLLNLRGRRLPLMTDVGRRWLADRLRDHGTDLVIVDPFGAAYAAAGGEKENDNGQVRRFLLALDEVKAEASVPTLLMPHHTGRAEQVEGAEHGRGATVLDDWPDVIFTLTKDAKGVRYLRSEGRTEALPESRLSFDSETQDLWLANDDIGTTRRKARASSHAAAVVAVVEAQPGMNATEVRRALADEGITNNDDQGAALRAAVAGGRIHTHVGKQRAKHHFAGPSHLEEMPCS